MKRRSFLKQVSLASLAATALPGRALAQSNTVASGPIVLSTWDFKLTANQTAHGAMTEGGSALDAVEKGIRVVEADPGVTSVGRGGLPDRDGRVTLDACVMDSQGNAGAVLCLEHIVHPVSVARAVMEKTPHVILTGQGALEFALGQGFRKEDLLTEETRKAHREWLKTSGYKPPVGEANHDTIGMLVMDRNGNLAGGCSTSGLAWKMRGRVGDSPIIGAGLYVDNEIGAATATGLGEAVIKVAGSFLIVEAMRNGRSPADACRMAVDRILRKQPKYREVEGFQVGFIALNKRGEVGAASYRSGFQYSLMRDGKNVVVDSGYSVK